ncbi:AcrR family transcriptional regulator [Phyllobacterium myrsinacearum]|uniref:AcrR family transcriptional regulator n=2 Tax=Phyllobacterium myrsinacearum TaxID=28101 RepID=A0A839EMJ7_9HYPH|nr:AcrR family transcriptional regulator [Phyllobacterium myrsinacearum]
MSDAGLTNGAFYPHFDSKAELVRECVADALEGQAEKLLKALASGGLELVIATYLSPEHRDNPGDGCASAALLPELARQPADTRQLYTDRLLAMVRQMSAGLPPQTRDPEGAVLAIYAMFVGTLQMARAVEGTVLSDRILAVGADAVRALAQSYQVKG